MNKVLVGRAPTKTDNVWGVNTCHGCWKGLSNPNNLPEGVESDTQPPAPILKNLPL